MDNQVPNLARNFILNLSWIYLEFANDKIQCSCVSNYLSSHWMFGGAWSGKYKIWKKFQWFIYEILSWIQYTFFYPRWVYGIKNTLINTVGFQGCRQNSAAFQIASLSGERGLEFHQQEFISLASFRCTFLFSGVVHVRWGKERMFVVKAWRNNVYLLWNVEVD